MHRDIFLGRRREAEGSKNKDSKLPESTRRFQTDVLITYTSTQSDLFVDTTSSALKT